jgi:hypothetical protein
MATPTGFQPPSTSLEVPVEPSGTGSAMVLRTLIDLARRYPRDDAAVERRLMAALRAYPDLADKAIYRWKNKDKKSRSGYTVISGMSIRAAEALASELGYIWTDAVIGDETAEYVDVIATAFDAQRANVQRRPFRTSRLEKGDDGKMHVLGERRMLMAIQAGISKAVRNAIIAVVPYRIRAAFEHQCRELIAGGNLTTAADPTRVKACLEDFLTRWKVTEAQLVAYVGRPRAEWVGADLADLKSLFTGLEEGDVVLQEVFATGGERESVVIDLNAATVVDVKDGQLGPADAPAATPPEAAKSVPPPPSADPVVPGGVPYEEVKKLHPTIPVPGQRQPRPAKPRVVPQPVEMPAPQPIPPKGMEEVQETFDEEAWRLKVSVMVREAKDIDALNVVLGRIYNDPTVPKHLKREAYGFVSQRRDQLQKEG